MTYEGWANYQTWNVSLWIANDENLYNEARLYAQAHMNAGTATYRDFVSDILEELLSQNTWAYVTPDGVSWTDPTLDHESLDTFIRQLGE